MQLIRLHQVWTDPEEGDVYFVGPEARNVMEGSARLVTLVLCQSRQGVNFIWPVNSDTRSGGGRGWAESARAAAKLAETKWIKIHGNRSAGAYDTLEAANQVGEPNWPDVTISELLKLGFKDRVINSSDHPIARKLQGF